MFPYFGSKEKISKLYPEAKEDCIVEPFAGSGKYSLSGNNWKKQVILNDKYEAVYLAWSYLINCSIKDLENLPDLTEGLYLPDLDLSKEERCLLGFYANFGVASPRNTVTKVSAERWKNRRINLINSNYKVKHWKIYNTDYEKLDNIKATWFIDPPYVNGGHYYKESNKNLDYKKLADWCLSRNGELIVCENDKANWLPFVPFVLKKGQKANVSSELIYYRG